MEQTLSDLTERLKTAFSVRLVSIVLYGSAAMDDWRQDSSDLNILCVLDRLSSRELAQSEPIFRWWRSKGNPPPLLLTEDEVRTSTDCFPIEFHDMQEHRRVLYGLDVVRDLVIDRSFYRAHVEYQLRAKQIRLRQQAAEVLSNSNQLTKLLRDSLSTFCVLGRHALLIANREPRWKKHEIIAALEPALNLRLDGANAILAMRNSGKGPEPRNTLATFQQYLAEMEALVNFVDGLGL